MELILGHDWYFKGGEFNLNGMTDGWNKKLQGALAGGSGACERAETTFCIETSRWTAFCECEQKLDRDPFFALTRFGRAGRWTFSMRRGCADVRRRRETAIGSFSKHRSSRVPARKSRGSMERFAYCQSTFRASSC